MSNLNIKNFEDLINKYNTGLITGNGFSINFDKGFCSVYESLEKGIKTLINNGTYRISPAAKPPIKQLINKNYKNVLQYLRYFNQIQLEEIFRDGVEFAGFIIHNEEIIRFLETNKYIHKIDLAPDMVEITKNIYKIGKVRGFSYVNIENWPVLMWLYYLVKDKADFIKFKQKPNKFITLLMLGEKVIDPNSNVMGNTRFNGFYIFYRLLMITIIFNDGKAVDVELLEKSNSVNNIEKISIWLNSFKELFSLNYDLILDQVSRRPVTHLHGQFLKNTQGYTYFQSYSLKHKENSYYSNNIIMGDYITTKVLDGLMYKTVLNKHALTEPHIDTLKELQSRMSDSDINHIVIFGMNPDNDYHILSGICFQFISNKVADPNITFCFYNANEIEYFNEVWNHVLNTIYKRKEEYTKQIKVNYIDSKLIISRYFTKQLSDIYGEV